MISLKLNVFKYKNKCQKYEEKTKGKILPHRRGSPSSHSTIPLFSRQNNRPPPSTTRRARSQGSVRGRHKGVDFVVLHEEFLQLGEDVFPVGVLPKVYHVGLDLTDEHLALVRLGHVDHLLHHIVCVLVLHHGEQGTVAAPVRLKEREM